MDGKISSDGKQVLLIDHIKELRRRSAAEAARDVLSLLPLGLLHHQDSVYFYLEPSTCSKSLPRINAYLMDNSSDGFYYRENARALSGDTKPRRSFPSLVEASKQMIIAVLAEMEPGLQVEWATIKVRNVLSQQHVWQSDHVAVLKVSLL